MVFFDISESNANYKCFYVIYDMIDFLYGI